MATRKYSKSAKSRKNRTYRKRKTNSYSKTKKKPSKKVGSTLSKRQKALFFATLAGYKDDSEE